MECVVIQIFALCRSRSTLHGCSKMVKILNTNMECLYNTFRQLSSSLADEFLVSLVLSVSQTGGSDGKKIVCLLQLLNKNSIWDALSE